MKSSALSSLFLCFAVVTFVFQPDRPSTSKWRCPMKLTHLITVTVPYV